jgi:large conductance mechanosensitive channel
MPQLLREFRAFLIQGNLIALAIAFVMAAAFGAVVAALVADLVTPIVAAIFGKPSFDDLSFTINGSEFRYGHFLNAVITFVSIAGAVFLFVLKPAQRLRLIPDAPDMKDCTHCTTEIPAAATRCPHCTAELA